MRILKYLIIIFITIISSCRLNMPEIINADIFINKISKDGFIISWENMNNEEHEIDYDCFILDDDKDYYSILGEYAGGVINSKKSKNTFLSNLKKRYKSIIKIIRMESNYIVFNDLNNDTEYFVGLMENNVTLNKIRRYEVIKIKTGIIDY